MIAPVSTNQTSVLPDTASVTVKPEVAATQTPQSIQPEKVSVPTATNQAPSPQDTVALSSTALNMSKALNDQADKRSEIKKDAAKDQAQSADKAGKAYLAAGKSYPPFMGNGDELKALKETSPSLYREILRMIVPPPFNISPMDLQILQGAQSSGSNSKSELTTA